MKKTAEEEDLKQTNKRFSIVLFRKVFLIEILWAQYNKISFLA